MARTADLVLMMLDSGKGDIQRELLEKELEAVGIRLNKKPPNIYFKVGRGGEGAESGGDDGAIEVVLYQFHFK